MKKYGLISSVFIIALTAATACGSSQLTSTPSTDAIVTTVDTEQQEEETKSEEVVEETKEEKVEEVAEPTLEEIMQESAWDLVMQQTFDFKCHDALYFDEGKSIAIGYAGETHYLNPEDNSWPRSENQSLCRYGIDMVDENLCFVTGNSNVTKSVDGGKTFVKKTDFKGSEFATMVSFIDENTGIAASRNVFGITNDGAETWNYFELQSDKDIICIKMETADRFFYVDSSLTLYITEDGGNSWTSSALNLPDGDNYVPAKKYIEITVDGENSYTVYCIQKGTFLLKSYSTNDGFATYTENAMPLLKVSGNYIHVEGNYLTLFNATKKEMTVIVKK